MAKDKEQKKTFVVYEDMMNIVLSLPDDAALDFTRTLFSYFLQKDYDATPISEGLLNSFKERISADFEKYEAACEAHRKAASNGGKQRAENARKRKQNEANASNCYQTQANATVCLENSSKFKQIQHDNDNVYDNDNGDDNVYENENVKRTKKMCSKEHIKEIVDAWNSIFENTDVPKVTVVKSGSLREKTINARLKENSKEDIIDAMHSAAQSSFLTQSSWFSFDWFMKPNNFVKVIEGNYKDHEQKPATQNKPTDKLQEFYETAVKWAEGG